jgi:chemotaxis protein CheX
MDVAYINPFLRATRDVFDAMVRVPIVFGKPRLKDREERQHKLYQISAVIGLSGAVSGLLVLCLSESVALALAGGLTGSPVGEMNADCYDALAEICNMIAGSAKKDLPGGQVTISIPTLLPTDEVPYPRDVPIILLPFDTAAGRFLLEVTIKSRPPTAGAPAN